MYAVPIEMSYCIAENFGRDKLWQIANWNKETFLNLIKHSLELFSDTTSN